MYIHYTDLFGKDVKLISHEIMVQITFDHITMKG